MVDIGEKEAEVEVTNLPLTPMRNVRIIEGKFEELIKEHSEDFVTVVLTDTEEIEKWKLLYQNFLDNYKLPEYSIKNSYKPAYFIAKGFKPEDIQLWHLPVILRQIFWLA
jgi:hypothetical protein